MNDDLTTWRFEIAEAMKGAGDPGPIIYVSGGDEDLLDSEFDSGFGGSEGKPFTAWTKRRVYFPVVYDGAEWVSSVPRDPCDEKTHHVGGE